LAFRAAEPVTESRHGWNPLRGTYSSHFHD
jgi:hypothetical protein